MPELFYFIILLLFSPSLSIMFFAVACVMFKLKYFASFMFKYLPARIICGLRREEEKSRRKRDYSNKRSKNSILGDCIWLQIVDSSLSLSLAFLSLDCNLSFQFYYGDVKKEWTLYRTMVSQHMVEDEDKIYHAEVEAEIKCNELELNSIQ